MPSIEIKPPLRRWEIALIFLAGLAGFGLGIPLFFRAIAWVGKVIVEGML